MSTEEEIQQTIDLMKDSLLLTDSRVGVFLVYRNDNTVSKSIDMYGEYCQAEINILKQYLPDDTSQYIDIGTNVGYHLVAVHKETNCNALGFEPNPKHFAVASYNSKDYPKIQIINAGASNKKSERVLKDFDPEVKSNYGDIHIINSSDGIPVRMLTLDNVELAHCNVIKIDVEGHEFEALQGCVKTISKFRPVIFYEAMDWDVWNNCQQFLEARKYKQYWVACRTKPIAETFKHSDENPFEDSTVANILAIPAESAQPDYLVEVVPGEGFIACFQRYKKLKLLY